MTAFKHNKQKLMQRSRSFKLSREVELIGVRRLTAIIRLVSHVNFELQNIMDTNWPFKKHPSNVYRNEEERCHLWGQATAPETVPLPSSGTSWVLRCFMYETTVAMIRAPTSYGYCGNNVSDAFEVLGILLEQKLGYWSYRRCHQHHATIKPHTFRGKLSNRNV